MSITVSISTNPATYSPTSNTNIWFRFNSASYSLTDFKYYVELYELDGLSNTVDYLGAYRFPPRPNGDGLYSPASILSTIVSYTLSPTASLIEPETNSIKQYSLNYGYEYSPNLSFVDTFISGTSVGFTFSTIHNFQTGDIVNINKTNKNINAYYDGQATITSVGSSYSFVIDKAIGLTSSVETGIVTDVISIVGQSGDFWAYNGKRQYDQIGINFGTTYVSSTNSSTFSFLENYVGYKPIFIDQYETTQLYAEDINQMTFNVASYDSSFNFITDADLNGYYATGSGYISFIYPTGTKNLTELGFTFSGATYYKLSCYIGTASGSPKAILWRKIECNPSPFPNVRIAYMNDLGSFEYINFNYDSKESYSISKTEYTKTLDWNYNIGDRGRTIISKNIEKSYMLNTDWLTEYQYGYYLDLLKSEEVYIIDILGNKYPVIINDSSFEKKTTLRDKLFSLQLNVTTAYQIK